MAIFGAPGVGLQLDTSVTNTINLPPGATYQLLSGRYIAIPGPYSTVQFRDPISGQWRNAKLGGGEFQLNSDGNNYRLANLSGCVRGVRVTNAGSGYTSAPTVTASAGSSAYTAIVGGAIGAVTIGTAGVGYTHTPVVVFSPPSVNQGNAGLTATGYATVSGGAVTGITVVDQGAGYTSAPTITIIPDPRDSITTAATATTTISGSAGTVTAVLVTDQGLPQTSVPTLSFSGGGGSGAAGIAAMLLTVTGFTVTTGGAGYGNAQPFAVETSGGLITTAAAVNNPQMDNSLFLPRQAAIVGTSTAGGAIQTTGALITDAGLFEAVPSAFVFPGGSGLATTTGVAALTVGGTNDTCLLQPC